MLAAVVGITAFLVIGTATRGLVPSRLQSAAELSYEFVATTVRSTAGSEGMRFFPFVFTLFMFILTVNMIGLIPYTFTVTSHIIVTAALAITVFLTVLIYGLIRHGLHFFNLFVPKGVPIYILPLIVFIEILSFISRPISHSVRLFANMLAGHITLQVFASFIILMGGAMGAIGWAGGVLPFAMIVILIALEDAGGVPAGLRLRHPHLHLSQRCDSPGPLRPDRKSRTRRSWLWIQWQRNTSVRASPASAWAAPASASASSSATTWPPLCAIRPRRRDSSAT